ncbi:MAG: hypothetical protein HC846_06570 [Blastocatellia bacterium]|nr:hypothetical protein [Blastocatellia bacterium]
MDKLNEYLNTLVKVSGSELRLEPNKPPFVITSTGQMIFPMKQWSEHKSV